jgi:kumamolisin
MVRRSAWKLATVVVSVCLMLVGASAASAASPTQTVAQGVDPATLPGTTVFGTTDPSTPETVSFIMREQNESQLAASVEQGVRSFESVSQFAARYGGVPSAIGQLRTYLSRFGITTTVAADQVDVVANGTAGEFDQALSVQQHEYHVPARRGHGGFGGIPAQTVHGTGQSPRLPGPFAGGVLAILGLSNYAPFTSDTAHATVTPQNTSQDTSTDSCYAISGTPDGCNLPQNFASNYGLNSVYTSGAAGQGRTIGVVTLAALDPDAPQYFWSNVANLPTTNRTVTVQNVDGGPGAPSDAGGSAETDLDVEQSGALAPDANVLVYQAPNNDAGFADAFFDAASDNVADSVSSSWGESETIVAELVAQGTETPAYQAAFDEAFLEFAAQGQSAFVSSDDQGAYGATTDFGTTGTTNLAVDTPGDSPYITSAGGTTLPWSGTLTSGGQAVSVSNPAQRIWGWDYLWPFFAAAGQQSLTTAAEGNIGGSGGGFSVDYPTPSYQRGVPGMNFFSAVPYLTPTDYGKPAGLLEPQAWNFNPAPPVISGFGFGRAEPDLSADADPFSGYLVYAPSFAQENQPVLEGAWGGTSFVAPQFNGSTAVIDSELGHRVGFWNPTVYAAASRRNSPLTPLDQRGTSNDNLYYTGTPGTVYNPGAGLGYPDLSALAQDFGR